MFSLAFLKEISLLEIRRPLIAMGVLILIGGMYSVVTTQITLTGQRVLDLQNRLERLTRENQQLEFDIAKETTFEKIEPRARALGLRPISPAQMTYLVVKNYPVSAPKTVPSAKEIAPSRTGFFAALQEVIKRVGLAPGTNAVEAGQ